MAVVGSWDGKPIQLNNAAEEATLERLVDLTQVLVNRMAKTSASNTSGVNGLNRAAGQASDQLDGLLRSSNRTSDGLDDLADSSRRSEASLNRVMGGLNRAGGTFARIVDGSADATKATQNVIDGAGDLLSGAVDGISSKFGLLGQAIGGGVNAFITLTTGALSFAIGAVQTFGEQFSALANTGIIFGEGISEMNRQVNASGMSLADFQKLAASSTEDLRRLGGTSLQGARQVLRLRTAMKGQEEDFLRLGVEYEDMAPLIADVAGSMARSGDLRNRSDQEIIDQTKKYAENLRVVSAITGEDAKSLRAKKEEARAQSENLLYLTRLREQIPGADRAFAAFQTTAAGFDPLFGKAVAQTFTELGVRSPDVLQLFNAFPGLQSALDNLKTRLERGEINPEEAETIFLETLKKFDTRISETGLALSQVPDKIPGAESFGPLDYKLRQLAETDIAGFQASVGGAKTNTDDATLAMIDLKKSSNDLAILQNTIAQGAVIQFAGSITGAAKDVSEALKNMAAEMSPETSAQRATSIQGIVSQANLSPGAEVRKPEGQGTRGGTRYTPEEQKQLEIFKNLNEYSDADLRAQGFEVTYDRGILDSLSFVPDALKDWAGERVIKYKGPPTAEPRMRTGGVMPNMGPDGMLARIGDGVAEAVVPLPDGKKIPVQMDNRVFAAMTEKLDLLARINGAMLDAMNQGNNISRKAAMYS